MKLVGRISQAGLIAAFLLIAGSATAQLAPAPAITTVPNIPADTAHLQLQRTQQGVRFVFRVRGTGALPQSGSRVAIRYTGFLPDGKVFDATAASGGPLRFRVGRKEVIAGFDDLLPLLPVGSRVRAWIPAALAYGATGVRDPDDETRFIIPPNTELIFELVIVSVR
jgi:FKBP-type peptidyl-prolyl cis-trans isomerase